MRWQEESKDTHWEQSALTNALNLRFGVNGMRDMSKRHALKKGRLSYHFLSVRLARDYDQRSQHHTFSLRDI